MTGPVRLVASDPAWAGAYASQEERIRAALGARALRVEHVGSTAVPGLVAKPIVDVLLVVADPADEAAYVPALAAAGYVVRIREPDWHEHRMLKGFDPEVNLHVFGAGAPEVERILRFRDRLRASAADRDRYAAAKRDLAGRHWTSVQEYADAKTRVIEATLAQRDAS